jgi:pimeloyl-ACP methyl ester carboxylesterase
MAHRFRLVETFDVADRLGCVHVPTLVLAGSRDPLVSARNLRMLNDGIPQVRLCRLSGCGHLAFATQPERVAREVEEFLAASERVYV